MSQRTEFGRILRKGLMRKGWTQRTLAKALGLHEDTISSWVTGKYPPGSASFARLVPLIPIPFDQLYAALEISSFQSDLPNNTRYRIASWDDVQSWNWTAERLLSRLIEIDHLLIDRPDFHERHEGDVQQWAPVFFHYPETWRLLIYGNENIVGYWHFITLNEEYYQLLLNGNLLDSMITNDAWEDISIPGQYRAYITFIGILKEHQRFLQKRMLFDSFIDQIVNLSKFGVYFSELTACGFTNQGTNACIGIGMEKVCDHFDLEDVGVYKLRLIPFSHNKKLLHYDDLVSRYSNVDLFRKIE